jgi:HEPN domain-containing protein
MLNKELIKFQEWSEKAQEDLQSAHILSKHNGAPAIVAFHAQQVVEKYLKGFLVFKNQPFEKTHHLDDLLRQCMKLEADFAQFSNEVSVLNDYYIESRYPIETKEDISNKEALEAIEIAEIVKEFVIARISE